MQKKKALSWFTTVIMFISLFMTTLPFAKTTQAASFTGEQWRVVEIPLTSTKTYANPFLDVSITATFTGPGGTVITRPGFWDGGDSWKVRFAPTKTGTWTYNVTSSDTTNSGLHNQSGTITANAYTGSLDIYKNGFLKKSADRYLSYANDMPFFWLGDTHWYFDWSESWSTCNKTGCTSQFKYMVDKRAAQKFTVYQSGIFGEQAKYWATGLIGTQIDPNYFKNTLDQEMKYIADSGLVNAFGTGWNYAVDNGGGTTEIRLAKYVVARYGAYPMVWITGSEVGGYNYGSARDVRLDAWRQVAQEIDANDAYNQPQTAHYTADWPTYYQGESWYDFTLLQGGHNVMPYTSQYLNYYINYPTTPVIEGEANYEQINNSGLVSADMVRKTAWRAVQSGTFGYTYGAHGVWNAAWDNSDTTKDYTYGHRNWYDGIDFIGADQMTHVVDFYTAISWQDLIPRPSGWAAWNLSLDNRSMPVVKADDGKSTVVVYFPAEYNTTGSVGTLNNLQSAAYTGQWFNPRTGAYTTISSSIVPTNGNYAVPQKPDSNDWVLLLSGPDPIPTPPPSGNLISNPGFETGSLSSWGYSGTLNSSVGVYNGSFGQDGTWYGYLQTATGASLYQDLTLTAGDSYTFTAKTQTSGATYRLSVLNTCSGNSLVASQTFNNTSWSTISLPFTASSNCTVFRVGMDNNGSSGSSDWTRIDTVNVAASGTTPTPDPLQTIYTTQTGQEYNGGASYELGTKFKANVAGTITKVRLHTGVSEGGAHTVRIWDDATSTVVAGPYTWNITSGTDSWKEFTLPTPLSITANTDYIVAVSTSSDYYYYADGGQFNAPIHNGNLITYTGSGLYNATLGSKPNASTSNNGYFRDIVFQP